RIVGVDANPKLIAQAQTWIGNNPRVELRVGDVGSVPYGDHTFTKIICSEVLEHLPNPVGALRELRRVLMPSGTLAVTVPNHRYPLFFDPLNWVREHLGLGHFSKDSEWLGGLWANHLRLYTPKLLADHLNAGGFQIDDMRALTRACVPFHSLILYAGRQAYTRLPAPESVRATMEKFSWREHQRQSLSVPHAILRSGFKVFQAVDRRNERTLPLDGPSVHLAARVHPA
ncbi:MAG: group 1 glycosyl transferase, partial [Parcubacteria group bacterium Gr01-1014_106]